MKVKFLPQNVSVEVPVGSSVLEAARANKLPISSSCNGMCACAECRVYIVEGEACVLPPNAKEVELIGAGHFLDDRRLSCQLFCFGDVTVDLSEQVEKLKYRKGITKQFLNKIHKKEVSSVGEVLIQQDQEIKKITNASKMSPLNLRESGGNTLSDDFYSGSYDAKVTGRRRYNDDNKKRFIGNRDSRDWSGGSHLSASLPRKKSAYGSSGGNERHRPHHSSYYKAKQSSGSNNSYGRHQSPQHQHSGSHRFASSAKRYGGYQRSSQRSSQQHRSYRKK